jgi:hypothetical protein
MSQRASGGTSDRAAVKQGKNVDKGETGKYNPFVSEEILHRLLTAPSGLIV